MHLLKKVRSGKPSTFHKQTNKWIMKRSRLRSKFWNTKCYIDEKTYNKQRNICVRVYSGKQRKNFFGNINVRDVTDNKKFWETVKPYSWAKLKPIQKVRLLKKKKKKKKRKENIRLGRDTSPIEFEEVISGLWHNWNF